MVARKQEYLNHLYRMVPIDYEEKVKKEQELSMSQYGRKKYEDRDPNWFKYWNNSDEWGIWTHENNHKKPDIRRMRRYMWTDDYTNLWAVLR